jgi:hypothetical protein
MRGWCSGWRCGPRGGGGGRPRLLHGSPPPWRGRGWGRGGSLAGGLVRPLLPQPLPRNLPATRGIQPLSPRGRGVGERGESRGLGARPLSPDPSPAKGEGRNSCASAGHGPTGSGAPAGSAVRCIGLPRNLRPVTGSAGLLSVRAEPVEALLEDLGARALPRSIGSGPAHPLHRPCPARQHGRRGAAQARPARARPRSPITSGVASYRPAEALPDEGATSKTTR